MSLYKKNVTLKFDSVIAEVSPIKILKKSINKKALIKNQRNK